MLHIVTLCISMHLSGKCPSQKWSNKSSECAAQESWWYSCKVPIWCMYPVVYFVWCIYRTSMLFDAYPVYPHRIAISRKPRTNILVVPRICHTRICRWMVNDSTDPMSSCRNWVATAPSPTGPALGFGEVVETWVVHHSNEVSHQVLHQVHQTSRREMTAWKACYCLHIVSIFTLSQNYITGDAHCPPRFFRRTQTCTWHAEQVGEATMLRWWVAKVVSDSFCMFLLFKEKIYNFESDYRTAFDITVELL